MPQPRGVAELFPPSFNQRRDPEQGEDQDQRKNSREIKAQLAGTLSDIQGPA